MPTKVRGRSTVSRWPEVCLPMAAGQKNEPPKGVLSPSRGVEERRMGARLARLAPPIALASERHARRLPPSFCKRFRHT